MNPNTYTTIGRNMRGELEAKTVIVLDFDRRELHVRTGKHSRGGISCAASVVQRAEDGRSYSHAMSFGSSGGDFSDILARDPNTRATSKAISNMHGDALEGIDDVIAKARAHYERKELREAADRVAQPQPDTEMSGEEAEALLDNPNYVGARCHY